MKSIFMRNRILITVLVGSLVYNLFGLAIYNNLLMFKTSILTSAELFFLMYFYTPLTGLIFSLCILPVVKQRNVGFVFTLTALSYLIQILAGGLRTKQLFEFIPYGAIAAMLTLFTITLFNKELKLTKKDYLIAGFLGAISNVAFYIMKDLGWLVVGMTIWQISIAVIINRKNNKQVTKASRQAGESGEGNLLLSIN